MWSHTFQLHFVSFWNIFLKKISAPHVCLFFGQDGGREKYPLPTTPPRVPLVTFLLKCSINDTALMFYMPSLLIYLLSGCLFSWCCIMITEILKQSKYGLWADAIYFNWFLLSCQFVSELICNHPKIFLPLTCSEIVKLSRPHVHRDLSV